MLNEAQELEQVVLGSIMICCDHTEASEALRQLEVRYFRVAEHARICAAMKILSAENDIVDALMVKNTIPDCTPKDFTAIARACDAAGTASALPTYAAKFLKMAKKSELTRALTSLRGDSLEEPVEKVISNATLALDEVSRIGGGRKLIGPNEACKIAFDAIEKRVNTEGTMVGIGTGIDNLDALTSGFCSGEVTVIAARPSIGKTALALGMACSASEDNKVIFVSREMNRESLFNRLTSSVSGVALHRLRAGNVQDHDWPRIMSALNEIKQRNLWVTDDGGRNIAELGAILDENRDAKALFIDYLQLLDGEGETREREVAGLSRGLKCLAMEHDIPIIILAQLNRGLESRSDKRPQLSDLRESGAIEQDADVVIFIYRDEYYDSDSKEKGIAELIIGKSRNGPTGTVKCKWIAETTSFKNLVR